MTEKLWRVVGTKLGRTWTVTVRAASHEEAVQKATKTPDYRIQDCVLVS
jgi:hypothetical protein